MKKEEIEEKKVPVKFNRYDLVAVICLFIFLGFAAFLGVWQNIAEKEYMSSLTPGERQQIAEQEEIERIQADQRSQETWSNFWAIWQTPIPLGFVLLLIIAIFYYARRGWGI